MRLPGFLDQPTSRTAFLIGAIAALAYALFPALSGQHFLSPDETANAAFARAMAEHGVLRIEDSFATGIGEFVRPRSFGFYDGAFIPASFAAFPAVAGLIGLLFGTWIIPFVSLILFVGSVVGVFVLASYLASRRAGLLAVFLYALHPVVAYYSMRGLWHNGAMVFSLLIALALLVSWKHRPSAWRFFAGIFFLGLSVALRLNELPWIVVLSFGVFMIIRPVPWRYVLGTFIVTGLMVTALLFLQARTFGNALGVGYNVVELDTSSVTATANTLLDRFRDLLFPFGFHPMQSLQRFWGLSFSIVGPALLLSLLGVIQQFRRSNARRLWFTLSVLVTFFWLMFSYGSYSFSESFNGDSIVLGSSYLRYWLPIYAFTVLFVGEGVALLRRLGLSRVFVNGLVVFSVVSSVYTSIGDPLYGMLKALRSDLAIGRQQRAVVLPLVPDDAVILAGTADKVYYPERRVIGYNRLTSREAGYIKPIHDAGIGVYLTTGRADDLRQANLAAKELGLRFHRLLTLPGGEGLYELGVAEGGP